MKSYRGLIIVFLMVLFLNAFSSAAIVQVDGKWSDAKYAPTHSVSEHFDLGHQLLANGKIEEALVNFLVIVFHYSDTPFYSDSVFFSGICYYLVSEFDLANKQFDTYLNLGGNLKYFEKVFLYKYRIAEQYSEGAKKRLFGSRHLSKIMPAKGDAIKLYDEIIAALPSKELAAQSLYGKAKLLKRKYEFRDSIDCLNTLTKQFPRHSMAAEGFLLISTIYLDQSKIESQNPDLLDLATINLNRFKKSFPGDERIPRAEKNLLSMQEEFARSLYETGRFYEKKKKLHASKIYYQETIRLYPATAGAEKCREKLKQISSKELAIQSKIAKKAA